MVKLKSHKKILDLIRIKKHTLHAAIKEHIEERLSYETSVNTINTYKLWYKRFTQFMYQFDSRNFALNNNSFAIHYQRYLEEHHGYANQSVKSHFSMLIATLNRLGIPNDINTRELFRGYAKQSKANEDFFLTDLEVKQLLRLNLGTGHEGIILSRFIVSCFTGCRVSEITSVCVVDENTLKYTSSKTKKDILVPYSDPVKPYIESAMFKRHLDAFTEGNPNVTLHKIFQDLGWDAPVKTYRMVGKTKETIVKPRFSALTFHSGRKFFGKMLLDRNVPMYKVSQMLGHGSIDVTQKYYAALSREKMVTETATIINGF